MGSLLKSKAFAICTVLILTIDGARSRDGVKEVQNYCKRDAGSPDLVVPVEASELLISLGFPGARPVPLMRLDYRIAQKLHALTVANSQRAHDLIDLQLIVARGKVDYAETCARCKRLFGYRQAQAWPPTVVEGEGWAEIYAEQSFGLDVLPDVVTAVAWANGLVSRIDRACGAAAC